MSGPARITVRDVAEFGRVAVLVGGDSAEREISLITGEAVLAALGRRGVDAHAIDTRDGAVAPLERGRYDRVWNALHGRGGEDGKLQGALEWMGLPYTGSGVLGSALSMDKLRSKRLFEAWGLATPRFEVLRDPADGPAVVSRLGLPLMVKPAGEGSSVGMTRVERAEDLEAAWREAARYDDCVLVEEWITGGEYSMGVLQGEALPIVRIETPRSFYDYQAKYFSDDTRYYCPSGLDEVAERRCRELALGAFEAVAAEGWGRVDFLLPGDGVPRFLEVNTVPGMTSHSLVPMGAKQAGIDFDELVWRILETSLSQRVEVSRGA